jgi:hypothetical protein
MNQGVTVDIFQDVVERNIQPEVSDEFALFRAFIPEEVTVLTDFPYACSERGIPEPIVFFPAECLTA